MENQRRAIALFSGGLDSLLAMKVVKDQGVDVVPINFVSHFFGGKNELAEKMASQIGLEVEYVDIKPIHTEIVKNPQFGRGKNMNPCIDCHGLMMQYSAEELLEKFDADFIISGEVVGQRPMSQNKEALNTVKNISGVKDLILRPMCAKHLEPTLPEREGWVDREKLLDIQGRSRRPQQALAKKFGITEYPSPAGGCLLTDVNYSKRLKLIEQDGYLDEEFNDLFYLIRHGRFYRFDNGKYLFVGRSEADNEKIYEYREGASIQIDTDKVAGPYILGFGELNEEEIKFAKELFSRYSKVKGKEKIDILVNGKAEPCEAVDLEQLNILIKKYQVQ
ncbi:tRNA (5-methylaminomethyl-2-thiouridylate)-methyltransferase [Sediminitomix flava]|uniref:tRNA-specific 2-thiouridylase n=1 Tax=Sediminitomix flava TaxID=379075 RepID=A0A315ZAU5_SEDFL|nr:tRNA (5-methylaminomethyl-2-thiouridylate)-methyltransferase [Sediminitomix flava]PWJ41844.1 tRNA-specific 2-thiouridylase [Sediminitomix flava]